MLGLPAGGVEHPPSSRPTPLRGSVCLAYSRQPPRRNAGFAGAQVSPFVFLRPTALKLTFPQDTQLSFHSPTRAPILSLSPFPPGKANTTIPPTPRVYSSLFSFCLGDRVGVNTDPSLHFPKPQRRT